MPTALDMLSNIPVRLKEVRAKLDFTQAKLAKLSGVTRQTICNAESKADHSISAFTLFSLCEVSECTPNFFAGIEEDTVLNEVQKEYIVWFNKLEEEDQLLAINFVRSLFEHRFQRKVKLESENLAYFLSNKARN